MKANPAQEYNLDPMSGHFGRCPFCGEQMDWFTTPRVHWNICDRCRVSFCPGSSMRLGDPTDGWEAQLPKLSEYRELSCDEYYGPFWHLFSQEDEQGPYSDMITEKDGRYPA